jgi:hypothetical protein
VSAAQVNPNDTVALTAGVFPVNGGTPTGTVSFSAGTIPLGTVPLTVRNGQSVADLYFPAYQLQGTGAFTLAAEYSGDAAFSSGGATRMIQIASASGVSAIIPPWPNTVWPTPRTAKGLTWQTVFNLREAAGVPALITSFAIDGAPQPVSLCFPSPAIPAAGNVNCTLEFQNLAAPTSRTFGIAGIDAAGQNWSRQFSVNYNPLPPGEDIGLTATPLTVTQNTAADPSCQWAVQLHLDDFGGSLNLIDQMFIGDVDVTPTATSLFGTDRLDALGSLQGTLCFGGITPPASDLILLGV